MIVHRLGVRVSLKYFNNCEQLLKQTYEVVPSCLELFQVIYIYIY